MCMFFRFIKIRKYEHIPGDGQVGLGPKASSWQPFYVCIGVRGYGCFGSPLDPSLMNRGLIEITHRRHKNIANFRTVAPVLNTNRELLEKDFVVLQYFRDLVKHFMHQSRFHDTVVLSQRIRIFLQQKQIKIILVQTPAYTSNTTRS